MSLGVKHATVRFPANSIIFRDGARREALFIVQSGQVAIFKILPSGERIPLGIIGSGEFLAESGLLDQKATHATWAVALSDVELIRIPTEAIEEQLKNAPGWLVALAKGLAQKLRHMNEIVRRNQVADPELDEAMLAAQTHAEKKKS